MAGFNKATSVSQIRFGLVSDFDLGSEKFCVFVVLRLLLTWYFTLV
jgi:hypothetical protein